MCHSAHIFRCSYSSRETRRLLCDDECSSPELCNPIQYCSECRNLSIPPDDKMSRKTRCVTVAESLFLKTVSIANARYHSNQCCMMTEGFKPLYPAMCVSPRHLQRCRDGAKCKSSNCFCPTLYLITSFFNASLRNNAFCVLRMRADTLSPVACVAT